MLFPIKCKGYIWVEKRAGEALFLGDGEEGVSHLLYCPATSNLLWAPFHLPWRWGVDGTKRPSHDPCRRHVRLIPPWPPTFTHAHGSPSPAPLLCLIFRARSSCPRLAAAPDKSHTGAQLGVSSPTEDKFQDEPEINVPSNFHASPRLSVAF